MRSIGFRDIEGKQNVVAVAAIEGFTADICPRGRPCVVIKVLNFNNGEVNELVAACDLNEFAEAVAKARELDPLSPIPVVVRYS